jgi:hypothetical protein
LVAADFLVFDLSRSRSPAYHVFTSGITQIKAQGITLPFHLPSLFRFFWFKPRQPYKEAKKKKKNEKENTAAIFRVQPPGKSTRAQQARAARSPEA